MAEVQEPQKKSGSKRGLIIAFVIIMLATNGVTFWFKLEKDKEVEQKEAIIIDQKSRIDSTSSALNKTIAELEEKKDQLGKLGADTSRLGEEIRSIMAERDKYRGQASINYSKFKKLQDEASGLSSRYDQEIARLKASVDSLYKENTKLSVTINEKLDTISNLKQNRDELAEKVAIASVLRGENFKIDAITPKGKEKEGGEFKAKAIDKLRIVFNVGDNKVAKKEGKDFLLRVVEPDGGALYDLSTGGGSFNFNNKDIFYTMKQNVLFTNTSQKMTFEYKKGNAYKQGQHKVEIYCEGNKIGESTFLVK